MNTILLSWLIAGALAQDLICKYNTWADKANMRDQGNTGMCWAFSTIAYLEATYNVLTGTKFLLSAEQISDNMDEYLKDDPLCARDRPGINGANPYCALKYLTRAGIMQSYNYPFTGAGEKDWIYNRDYISPIGIRNAQVEIHEDPDEAYKALQQLLLNSPVLISIRTPLPPDGSIIEVVETTEVNHAVLAVDICYPDIAPDLKFLRFQNSWGGSWGELGYGYVLICNETRCYNNLGVLSSFITAEIYDLYDEGFKNSWIAPKDAMSVGAAGLIIGLIAFIICLVTIIAAIIRWVYRKFTYQSPRHIELSSVSAGKDPFPPSSSFPPTI
jgi:hypothetical protein